jgi:hypothetical protein
VSSFDYLPGAVRSDILVKRQKLSVSGFRGAYSNGLLPEQPTPERCVAAYYLQRTRFESVAERKLHRRQFDRGWAASASTVIAAGLPPGTPAMVYLAVGIDFQYVVASIP